VLVPFFIYMYWVGGTGLLNLDRSGVSLGVPSNIIICLYYRVSILESTYIGRQFAIWVKVRYCKCMETKDLSKIA